MHSPKKALYIYKYVLTVRFKTKKAAVDLHA